MSIWRNLPLLAIGAITIFFAAAISPLVIVAVYGSNAPPTSTLTPTATALPTFTPAPTPTATSISPTSTFAPSPTARLSRAVPSLAKTPYIYVVRNGDSLWRIAESQCSSGNKWGNIASVNGMNDDGQDPIRSGVLIIIACELQ